MTSNSTTILTDAREKGNLLWQTLNHLYYMHLRPIATCWIKLFWATWYLKLSFKKDIRNYLRYSKGKFSTWLRNSALNCTRRQISHESRSDIGFQVQFNAEFTGQVMVFLESHNWIKIRKNRRNNTVCFYPEPAPERAISKSAVGTFIALANMKQIKSYAFDSLTTLFVPCACFYICFQSF